MKRLSSSSELILNRPLGLVGEKLSMLNGQLFFQLFESGCDRVSRDFGVVVVNGEFEQLAAEEATLDRAGLSVGEKAFIGRNLNYSQTILLSRDSDSSVKIMFRCPRDQFFRRVAPTESEWGGEDGLTHAAANHEDAGNDGDQGEMVANHRRTLSGFRVNRKPRTRRAGSLLVEAGAALSILTFVGLMMLEMSLNILTPRQWSLQQTITDAYMTYERSYAERIPFENLLESDSPWPAYPATSTVTNVELGRLPGDRPIYGTITRTRIPSDNNYPIDGGNGTVDSNPAAMNVWKVQSIVTYSISGRNYAKSRTVLRSQ